MPPAGGECRISPTDQCYGDVPQPGGTHAIA